MQTIDYIDAVKFVYTRVGIRYYSVVLTFQVFFLTMAKKNRTKMARGIEADKISPIGGSSKIPIVSSRDSKIN